MKYLFRKKGEQVQIWTYTDETLQQVVTVKSWPTGLAVLPSSRDEDIVYISPSTGIGFDSESFNFKWRDTVHPSADSRAEFVNKLSEFFAVNSTGAVAFGKFMRDEEGDTSGVGIFSPLNPKELLFEASQFGQYSSVEVNSILAVVEDRGSIDVGSYGNGIGLLNGIDIFFGLRGREFSILDGHLIKSTTDYAVHRFDLKLHEFGSGPEMFEANADMLKIFGKPLRMYGQSGDYIKVILKDSFAGLISHKFKISGVYV